MQSTKTILVRFLLTACGVLLCLQINWPWLCHFTSEAVLRTSLWMGAPAARVSLDTIQFDDLNLRFVTSCTCIDVFIGAIPLLWDAQRRLRSNLTALLAFGPGLFVLNIVRLDIGDALYFFLRIDWERCHTVISILTYCLIAGVIAKFGVISRAARGSQSSLETGLDAATLRGTAVNVWKSN